MQRNQEETGPADAGETAKTTTNSSSPCGDDRHHGLDQLVVCPISLERMRDPVQLFQSGITYDREFLCQSLLHFPTKDPKSNVEYNEQLRYAPNVALRALLTQLWGDEAFEEFDDSSFKTKYEEKWNTAILANRVRGPFAGSIGPFGSRGPFGSDNVESSDEDVGVGVGDFQLFQEIPNSGPPEITVVGAGHPSVNGPYSQNGFFENACRYAKRGRWNNADHIFYIFQCPVSNNTRHWYISIVPYGEHPGTSSDIDFYSAPVTNSCRTFPPQDGWVTASAGCVPPPEIVSVVEEAASNET